MEICVGRLVLAPGARPGTSRWVSSEPAPGSGSAAAMKTPTRNAGDGTRPRLRTVGGADTTLPLRVPAGVLTVVIMRSGRKSRIVSVAVLAAPSTAPVGLDSSSPTRRLPLRVSALAVRIGTGKVLRISPGPKVRTVGGTDV